MPQLVVIGPVRMPLPSSSDIATTPTAGSGQSQGNPHPDLPTLLQDFQPIPANKFVRRAKRQIGGDLLQTSASGSFYTKKSVELGADKGSRTNRIAQGVEKKVWQIHPKGGFIPYSASID